jgi:hypothetical protein
MATLRLGDDCDDFCVKCKRLTNHVIVSLMEGEPAKVRCRTCYSEQSFRNGIAPPSKRELKKAELFNSVLSQVPGADPPPEAPITPAGPKNTTPPGD